MAFVETLAPYFTDFGITATVGGVSVRGIFNNAYAAGMQGIIAGSAPVLKCVQADVASATRGTAVVVNSTNYLVAEVQDDGTGVRDLVLEEA